MSLKPISIALMRGDDECRLVRFRTKTAEGTPAPLDLTDFTRFDLHAIDDDRGETVLRLSSETGELRLLSAESGELLITIAHPLTETAVWESATYDLQAQTRQGQIRTLMRGRLRLIADITRI